MNKSLKKSEKLHLLSQNDFNRIQQHTTANKDATRSSRTIKNSKYKRLHRNQSNELDLFSLIKEKKKKSKDKLKFAKTKYVIGSNAVKKNKPKRYKVKENGKRKLTRLKKAIVKYRTVKKAELDPVVEELTEQLKVLALPTTTIVHSRRFRSYCDNCTSPSLIELTQQLLQQLDKFQKRAHRQNEVKAHAKRRFVVGFRECLNFLHINKAKLVIIATDCEESKGESGLDANIEKIKAKCLENNVPYLFSGQRRKMAYALHKKVPISCVCVLDYDGAVEVFNQLIMASMEAKKQYQEMIKAN